MSSFVEVITLRQPVCPDCGPLGELREQTDGDATGVCVAHDATHHSGYDSEGEDG